VQVCWNTCFLLERVGTPLQVFRVALKFCWNTKTVPHTVLMFQQKFISMFISNLIVKYTPLLERWNVGHVFGGSNS
jgi:hypothetical protein